MKKSLTPIRLKDFENKQSLQSLYDDCNFFGFCLVDGIKIYKHMILEAAAELNIVLTYNCPA